MFMCVTLVFSVVGGGGTNYGDCSTKDRGSGTCAVTHYCPVILYQCNKRQLGSTKKDGDSKILIIINYNNNLLFLIVFILTMETSAQGDLFL